MLFGPFLAWALAGFAVSRRRDRRAGTVYAHGTPAFDALTVVVGWRRRQSSRSCCISG
ncbi:MAG: hypothetical protein ACREP2_14985 [Rhodanobacteraceae bacterium]